MYKSIRLFLTTFLAIVLLFPISGLTQNLGEAFSQGKTSLDLRFRYEFVDQDGYERTANAYTLRFRLGYTTAKFYEFSLHLDMAANVSIGSESYNSTTNGKTDYPVVADPQDTEVNQAFLAYTGLDDTSLILGRQRIKLDNLRFVGNVGWRQLEQTFDAFKITNQSLNNTTLTFAYLSNVNRIFGEHSSRGDVNLNAFFLHGNYRFFLGGVSGYAHFFENKDDPVRSHRNLGARFAGDYDVTDDIKVLYALELTWQNAYKNGSENINVSYRSLEAGVNWMGLTGKFNYEVLGGNGDYGFSTPYATLHAFNGWADKFLVTPKNGLVDTNFQVAYNTRVADRPLVLRAVYHNYRSDKESLDYGSEWNFLAQITIWENFDFALKFADYGAKQHATNTTKFWFVLHYSF